MDNFDFCTPTEYVVGRDTEARTGELTRAMGCRRVLLVYGGGSAIRSGLLDRVKTSLEAAEVEFFTLGGIAPNPTDDRVYEGINLCREAEVDGIVAVAAALLSTLRRQLPEVCLMTVIFGIFGPVRP